MQQKLLFLSAAFMGLILIAPAVGQAQSEVVYPKHQVVTFGDGTIEGSLTRPDSSYTGGCVFRPSQRLIRIRDSFRGKVLATARRL